ncbi:GTPase-activating protein and VPS9 domain-containing protein 1 [Mactra antiquata]
MALGLDLAELSMHLRQERLFVSSERDQLQNLFEQVKMSAEQLYHQSWIGRLQKDVLDHLIGSSQQVTPAECCLKTNQLESLTFVDGYKHLSYHDSKYGEFLKFLVENPLLLGQLLYTADQNDIPNVTEMVKTLMHSVFGNCVLLEDETGMLQVLKSLLDLQLGPSENPRRMLRRGSNAFSIAFRQLFDVVYSAKLFLTAALHDPVMRLLMEDEWFYDIDPGKALVRFRPQERLRRFGEPGTDQYKEKLAKYRNTIVDKLVLMANRFIVSIKNNMHCFPPSLAWIISQVYQTLAKTGKVEMGEVRAVCADLVFALFICPAICDPEPHGITTDVPISIIARHNLMQVAQIIQVLAISQWEEIDPKLHDLYGKFEKGCMSTLLDTLLDGMGVELPAMNNSQLPCLSRTSSLIQLSQLNNLISFLKSTLVYIEDSTEKKCLDEMLTSLVPVTPQSTNQNQLSMLPSSNNNINTPPGTPSMQKKSKGKKKGPASIISQVSQLSDDTASVTSMSIEPDVGIQPTNQNEDVLVISLGNDIECPGMMSEQKVLSCEQENKRRKVKYQTLPGGYEVGPVEIQEKRTRFSLSHDQESIGNTSDIPEAISEGASSHSVGSQDLENDDDNDNFSDMISANVSGRGTPNISESGRDTPLSQAESGEQEPTPHPQPSLPETVQKKNREDVTDKFGKFEIKQELDYDLKSTVSDTWSTDVLASDSEPPELNQQVRLDEIAEEMVRQHLLATQERVSEISETASDAWSTDVLASDNEEKQAETFSEFDDMSSVAEMGSNLDDVRSESDIAEVTPLASGFQSPNEGVNDDIYPNTMVSTGGTSVTSDNVSMSPTFSDSVFSDIDDGRTSRGATRGLPVNNLPLDNNRLFVPIRKKRPPSPPGSSPDRVSDPGSYSQGARNRLVDFDLEPRMVPVDSSENFPRMPNNIDNLNLVSNPTPPTETGARPKTQVHTNLRNDRKGRKNMSNMKLRDFTSDSKNREVFMPKTTQEISCDSGIGSSQFTSSIESVGNSTEQQSTNVDEARFSAALSLFDPLATNSDMAGGDLLEGAASPPSQGFNNFKSTAFVDNAMKEPLVPINDTKSDLNQFKFDIRENEREGNNLVVNSNNMVVESNGCDIFGGTSEGLTNKRRGSTDSNQSSGSSLSKDGSASGLDTSASRQDDKEIINGDDSFTPGKKKGLFRTFKDKIHKVVDVTSQTAAGIKKKGSKQDKDVAPPSRNASDTSLMDSGQVAEGVTKGSLGAAAGEPNIVITETSDEILAKYRKKSILMSTPNTDPVPSDRERRLTLKDSDDTTPLYDANNLENCLAFLDAKRKLRIVLGSADFQQVGYSIFGNSSVTFCPRDLDSNNNNNDLVNLLRTQLSEATNLQNKDTIAQLHEALRCVRQFNNEGCKKLVRSLQEDYRYRSSYVSYLVRCKQGLLNTLAHINRLQNRIRREKEIYNRHMTSVCVRIFLETWEKQLMNFIARFQELTVADEKTDLLEKFLMFMYQNMNKDPIWQAASESQLDDARLAIERYMMSRIYTHAMFPNGDGDIDRDQLIQQHIKELSKVITPDHKDLKIPKMYHLECPWPAAQRELYMINAYKTPKDKVKCIQRCATTIMNLLSMANEKSVPAADDFTPVFIFVIIRANPPCLLSTIQYVNSFYQDRIQGEEQYWWMQFVGAVEFIKTMDYQQGGGNESMV